MSMTLPEALGILWSRFDQNRLGPVADLFCGALSDPDAKSIDLTVHEDVLAKVAARMHSRDLERLLDQPLTAGSTQRTLLNILGASKNRHFRNTWDYLDWTRAQSG
jgi:hypothetical protein